MTNTDGIVALVMFVIGLYGFSIWWNMPVLIAGSYAWIWLIPFAIIGWILYKNREKPE